MTNEIGYSNRRRRASRTAYILAVSFLLFASVRALGQDQPTQPTLESGPSKLDDIAITPSRNELLMEPGTERTMVVNIVYTAGSAKSAPARLMAYMNDWSITKTGSIEFYRAGSHADSACSWMIHSPVEMTVSPGTVHSIRVTISVPKDATPGDHTAALIIEPRADNIKLEQNKKQLQARFRLAAIFYVMVPQLTRKGSLQGLKAETTDKGIVIVPTIRNEGNSHIRPMHSVKIVDRAGVVAAEMTDSEWLPVLGRTEIGLQLLIEKTIPAGTYSVRYRVDFADGSTLTEGQTELIVKDKEKLAAAPGSSAPTQASSQAETTRIPQ